MPAAIVRYRSAYEELVVQNHGIIRMPDATAPLEVLGPASLASLEKAWARYAKNSWNRVSRISVSLAPAAGFEEDYALAEDVSFEYWPAYRPGGSDELVPAHLETVVEKYYGAGDPDPDANAVDALIAPVLAKARAAAETDWGALDEGGSLVQIRVRMPSRGRTAGDAFWLGSEISALIDAARDGMVVRTTVPALLRGAHAAALLGQPEAPWLEAKRAPYRLAADAEKLELAKDVAGIAAGRSGGLIVLGLATKRGPDGDVVSKLHPLRLSEVRAADYRRVINRYVYPLPEGLTIEKIDSGSGEGYVVIDIPEQPEELKPFLVTHALVGGRVTGNHVSIVQRHGQDNLAATPAAIHGLLVAGRAALAAVRGPSLHGPAREEADEA